MLERWQTAIICPIHKKGDKLPCSNYTAISLLKDVLKFLLIVCIGGWSLMQRKF
jgi:hypothetical protein